jgi:hypothetical protein
MQCNNWLINVTGPFSQPLFKGLLVAFGEWPERTRNCLFLVTLLRHDKDS